LEGNTEEALTLLQKAASLDPENAGIYHVLAGAHEKLNEFEQAEEYYRLSLALDSEDEECLADFIQLLSDTSLLEAFKYIREFNEKIGGNKIAPVLEVNVLYLMGKKSEALALFTECVETDREKAREIFDINPDLLNVEEFVNLAED
jgi:tetratricopeptide (TPR) repeat protein